MQGPSAPASAKFMFMFVAASLVWACMVPGARAQAAPQGWWLDQTGRAGILIAPCGAKLCGRIEWLKSPLTAQGQPKTDIHNPDNALRQRPLCGLPMLGGFVPDGDGGWTGGWVYDPELGKTYKSLMHIDRDATLRVRGYIGIPLFGRSAVWTKLPPPPQCKVP